MLSLLFWELNYAIKKKLSLPLVLNWGQLKSKPPDSDVAILACFPKGFSFCRKNLVILEEAEPYSFKVLAHAACSW